MPSSSGTGNLKEHYLQLFTRVMPDWKEKEQRLDVYDFG